MLKYYPRRSKGQYYEYITRAKALPILSRGEAKDNIGNAEACVIYSYLNIVANHILLKIKYLYLKSTSIH